MEELFSNFIQHIEKLISPNLSKTLKSYMNQQIENGINADDYTNIENDIKVIMADYFQKAKDKDYVEMATNLFNSFVEMDDANLLRAVKYFIRIYSYFQEIKLKKKLYQWRIIVIRRRKLARQNNNNNNSITNYNTNTNSHANSSKGKIINNNKSNNVIQQQQHKQWATNY